MAGNVRKAGRRNNRNTERRCDRNSVVFVHLRKGFRSFGCRITLFVLQYLYKPAILPYIDKASKIRILRIYSSFLLVFTFAPYFTRPYLRNRPLITRKNICFFSAKEQELRTCWANYNIKMCHTFILWFAEQGLKKSSRSAFVVLPCRRSPSFPLRVRSKLGFCCRSRICCCSGLLRRENEYEEERT